MFGGAQSFRYTMPGGPSPCPREYHRAFGSAAAAVLPPPPWHVRGRPRLGKWSGSAPVPAPETCERPVAASSTPGGLGTTPVDVRTRQALHPPILGLGCLSHLHPARVTTLHTEGPRVRRGRRTRAGPHMWLAGAALFFTGFRPEALPTPSACCIVLIPLSTYGSLKEQSLAPLKGAPERPR
jgi:hypothetical protein